MAPAHHPRLQQPELPPRRPLHSGLPRDVRALRHRHDQGPAHPERAGGIPGLPVACHLGQEGGPPRRRCAVHQYKEAEVGRGRGGGPGDAEPPPGGEADR